MILDSYIFLMNYLDYAMMNDEFYYFCLLNIFTWLIVSIITHLLEFILIYSYRERSMHKHTIHILETRVELLFRVYIKNGTLIGLICYQSVFVIFSRTLVSKGYLYNIGAYAVPWCCERKYL